MLTEAERSAILDAEVARFVAAGYRLIARTPTSAQVIRPKQFSAALAIGSLLLCGIGLLVYLFLYWSEQDKVAYLTVDAEGRIDGQGSGIHHTPHRWACPACGESNKDRRASCRRCGLPRP